MHFFFYTPPVLNEIVLRSSCLQPEAVIRRDLSWCRSPATMAASVEGMVPEGCCKKPSSASTSGRSLAIPELMQAPSVAAADEIVASLTAEDDPPAVAAPLSMDASACASLGAMASAGMVPMIVEGGSGIHLGGGREEGSTKLSDAR